MEAMISFYLAEKMARKAANTALEFAARMAEECIKMKNPAAIPAAIRAMKDIEKEPQP